LLVVDSLAVSRVLSLCHVHSLAGDGDAWRAQEWARFLHDELRVPLAPRAISDAVVERLAARYRAALPIIPGATEAVKRMASRWPLGLASSSNPEIIELVLEQSGLAEYFEVALSSQETGRGKPAPDVYLAAVEALGVQPRASVAIEDSGNGIRAAHTAGMRVVAIPNPDFPPGDDALAQADVILGSIAELTPAVVT
jgi:HAD superfamily hydrolase (TIGR01509 family)